MDMQPVFTIEGREDIAAMLNAAPEVFIRYYRAVLNAGGTHFIGRKMSSRVSNFHGTGKGSRAKVRNFNAKFFDPGKVGLIQGQLKGRLNINRRPYSDKFIRTAASYRIENGDQIEMTLKAGTLYSDKKKIHEIIEFLEQGGTINSSEYMPVPIYENFSSKLDQFKGYRGILAKLIRDKRIIFAVKNGEVYYIDKVTEKLLAVGRKSVTVRKQFEFYGKWAEAYPKILHDLEQATHNATRDIVELN